MSTTVPCDKCDGKGTIEVTQRYCEAAITVRHETFTCFAMRQHPGHPHAAVLQDKCPSCLGYDEHADGCPRVGETTTGSGWYSWSDVGLGITRMTEDEGRAWRAANVL